MMQTLLKPSISIGQNNSYYVSVIQNGDALEQIGPELDAFLTRVQFNNNFMSFAWLKTHLTYYPPERLLIIIIRDSQQQQLVGLVPFKITSQKSYLLRRKLKTLSLMGSFPQTSDYPQICIDPAEERDDILKLIAETLIAHKKCWDILHFLYYPDEGLLLALKQQLQLLGEPKTRINFLQDMPSLPLPDTLTSFHKNLSKRMRKNLNNIRNRLATDYPGESVQLVFESDLSKLHALVNTFRALNTSYWSARKKPSVFERYKDFDGFLKDILTTQADKQVSSSLQFSLLMIGNRPMSFQLGLWQGNRYMAYLCNYLSEFERYKPGLLHFEMLIEDTISRGGQTFEFGRGDEAYKYLWANQNIPLWELYTCAKWVDFAEYAFYMYLKAKHRLIKPWIKQMSEKLSRK
jgi:CelD/BcsL family acetyltransferase involved in cellulose biosynthesis